MTSGKNRIKKNAHPYEFTLFHRKYFQDLRKRFPKKSSDESVVLCEMIPCYNVSHCFLNTAHAAAGAIGAQARSFSFCFSDKSESWRFWKSFYRECGAPLVLTNKKTSWNRLWAQLMARNLRRKIHQPEDVLAIRLGSVQMGPLIYQTYLGVERPTMDIKDPYLFQTILQSCHIYLNCRAYLRQSAVRQVIISHNQYIHYGILTRLAVSRGIPVITPYAHGWRRTIPFTLRRTDPVSMMPFPPYHKFETLFRRMPAKQRIRARQKGRKRLLRRLGGRLDLVALKTGPGYLKKKERILMPTGKKKILIMLNCFFDGPNIFRFNLFPDFYRWAVYTLEKARLTDFEWYVKPHPVGVPQNDRVVAELKKKFPEAHFLPKTTSNWTLLENKIASVFTTHGTCIHEFAYRGVPVVATGDNFHINYDFYLLPKTLQEYDQMIFSAGNLKIEIKKSKIEEFFYMNYLRFINVTRKCRLFPLPYENYVVGRLGYNPLRNYLENPRALEYLVRNRTAINYPQVRQYVKQFVLNPAWDEEPPLPKYV